MTENKILAMTARTQHLVNRTHEMDLIHKAISAPGVECRIVLIKGPGGLGKTRLLEEVQRRTGEKSMRELYGPPPKADDWINLTENAAFIRVIDLTDVKYHIRELLLQQLGDPTNWNPRVDFHKFAEARNRYQHIANVGAAYSLLGPAIEQIGKAFEEDLSAASKTRRLVILFDTAEQLSLSSSKWLQNHHLVGPEDLASSAQQWLLKQIAGNKLGNVTLIIAGRDAEGGYFFDELKRVANAAKSNCLLYDVNLAPFDLTTTKEYLAKTRIDWEANAPHFSQTLNVLATLDEILDNDDRLKVLHLYTNGNPVLLSMYIDILYEGRSLPKPLQDTFEEASKRTAPSLGLKEAQTEIETSFVDILFRSGATLRAQILQALVRAPRGLDSDQLHFFLDSSTDSDVARWTAQDERLKEIERELGEIRKLTLVRLKSDGRFGLQDEIYRIYAERIQRDPLQLGDEKHARAILYAKMLDWASHQVSKLEEKRRELLAIDLSHINVERPAKVLSSSMQSLTDWEQEQRQSLSEELVRAELEQLHYALLVNPSEGFNFRYYNLSLRQSKTFNPAAVAMAQAEMWRILSDRQTLTFTDIPRSPAAKKRGESGIQVLQRAAEQDIVAQTIVDRFLRKAYMDAVGLADRIDAVVNQLADGHEKNSWNHTLAKANRGCWREFARIYAGLDIPKAINALKEMAASLESLRQADYLTMVFEDRGSGERGFKEHPAEQRLIFLLANIYDFIGYGEVSLGNYQQAVENYTTSLQYWRQHKLPVASALEASTRNNLSRALVEMGKKRAIRVCLDALQLRIRSHELLPIALSYNTLSLIQNDLKQPTEALDAGARALAIAQYIGDTRVVGLAMLQVGEALRRLATSVLFIYRSGEVQSLFDEAERALRQAYSIFSEGEASQETIRRVEAALELGILYREWVASARFDNIPTPGHKFESRLENAQRYLTQAAKLAGNRVHLALEAWVNIAWTHYYAEKYDEALLALEEADKIVDGNENRQNGSSIRLQRRHDDSLIELPDPDHHPVFWYKQLSKMHTLRGQIALTHFQNKGASDSAHQDASDLNSYLESAAYDYTLALAYAQLFAPGSAPLAAAYDSLYDFLRKLNLQELSTFYRYESQAHEAFAITEISRKFKNLGDLGSFLKDCFGDPDHLAHLANMNPEGAQSGQG